MPAPFQHLKHAPIVEAVLDIRVSFPGGFDVEKLKEAQGILKDEYPEIKEERMFEVRHHFDAKNPDDDKAAVRKHSLRGYKFISSGNKQLVQFRKDGFTFNRLSPYPSWEDVRTESIKLWEIYSSIAKDFDVLRLALRYINKIQINLDEEELSDVFTPNICVPNNLNLEVGSFLNQTVVKRPDSDVFANYTLSRDSKNINQLPVEILLDIDVYRNDRYDNSVKSLFDVFEELRLFKNELFFSSITPSALTRFQND